MELDNIINKKDCRTYTKLIMDYCNISYSKKNKYYKSSCIIKNCIGVKYKSKFCVYHYENYKDLTYIKDKFK